VKRLVVAYIVLGTDLLIPMNVEARIKVCSVKLQEIWHLVDAMQSAMPIVGADRVHVGDVVRNGEAYCAMVQVTPAPWIHSQNYQHLAYLAADARLVLLSVVGPTPLCTIPSIDGLQLGDGIDGIALVPIHATYTSCDNSISIFIFWDQDSLPITLADEMTHAVLWMTARPFEHCLPQSHNADCDAVDRQMRLAKQEAALNDAIAAVSRSMPVQRSDTEELVGGLGITEEAQMVGGMQGSQGGSRIPRSGDSFEQVAANRRRRDEDETVPLEIGRQSNWSPLPFRKSPAMPGDSPMLSAQSRLPLRSQYFT